MCGVCTAVRPSPQVNVTSGWTWKAAYGPMTPSIIIQRNWIDCLLPIKEPTYHMSFVAIGIKSCLLQTICSEGFTPLAFCNVFIINSDPGLELLKKMGWWQSRLVLSLANRYRQKIQQLLVLKRRICLGWTEIGWRWSGFVFCSN